MGTQTEDTICEPGNGISLDTESSGALTMNFQPSELSRNKCLLLISPPVCGVLLWSPKLTSEGQNCVTPLGALAQCRMHSEYSKWLLNDPYCTSVTAPRYSLLFPYPCSSEIRILQTTLELPPHLEFFCEGMRMHWRDNAPTWQRKALVFANFVVPTTDADPTDQG